MVFEKDRDYNNVYFLKIDAKGHSKMVEQNASDKVDAAFDAFEEMVFKIVDDSAKKQRCEYAKFWGWEGDGGLCILFDKDESYARKTTVNAAEDILSDIPHLNETLLRKEIKGFISVRIALHKGSFRYKGDDRHGSIHSKELNFCSHLEKIVPHDTIAISSDVHKIMGIEGTTFTKAPSEFEGREIYLKSHCDMGEIIKEWQTNCSIKSGNSVALRSDIPVSDIGLIGIYSQRTVGSLYGDLLGSAKEKIWALGIGLGGFQTDHRQVMADKGKQGIEIRLLAVDPLLDKIAIRAGGSEYSLPAWRDYETKLGQYNSGSLASLKPLVVSINEQISKYGVAGKTIELRYYRALPTFAMLLVDSIIFISPYLIHLHSSKMATYSFSKGGRHFDQYINHFLSLWDNKDLSRDALA